MKRDRNFDYWALRESSAELRAIGNLYRLARTDDAPPLDAEEVNWGMSLLLERIAKRVRRAANRIDEAGIENERHEKPSR
jgi:hypothetical protein